MSRRTPATGGRGEGSPVQRGIDPRKPEALHKNNFTIQTARTVIARSKATKQSILSLRGWMDCFASLAMTAYQFQTHLRILAAFRSSSSYPAQAGYPVRRGFSILSLTSRNTGSPAFAGDDGSDNFKQPRKPRLRDIAAFRSSSSYPAQAGYPVRRGFSILSLTSRNTGSPAFAGDDGSDNFKQPRKPRLRILAALIARGVQEAFAPKKIEGAGNAGCPMHPQPRV
jgi:hypothetical protein